MGNALFPKRIGSTSSRSESFDVGFPPGFASLNLGLPIFDPFGVFTPRHDFVAITYSHGE